MNNANIEVEKARQYLNRLIISINKKKKEEGSYAKGKEVLNNSLQLEISKLEEIKKQYEELLLKKQHREKEINDNHKYYENRNIIMHIRNALAHGNFEVERFTKEGNLGKAKIHIQDLYMEKNTFDSVVSLDEFTSLFNRHNYQVIFGMYDELIEMLQNAEKEGQGNKLNLK
jgi:hypothetical protein